MGDYFKWDSGQAETPPAHAESHEPGGDDEITTLPNHATTHQSGGGDAIKLDDLAAPDDNTDLDVSTAKHGLVPKAPNDTTKFLRGDGAWVQIVTPVPLTTPLVSTNFDGDPFSTLSKTLMDMSAEFGVPAGIKKVLLYVACRDSASAANDCRVYIGPNNTAYSGAPVNCEPVNDRPGRGMVEVPCDANGDVYYQIVASGTDTFDLWIQVFGYWI